jgi:hypothetical protein
LRHGKRHPHGMAAFAHSAYYWRDWLRGDGGGFCPFEREME